MTFEQGYSLYKFLMIDAFESCRKGIKTDNYIKTKEWIMNHVYCIDANPRPATLTLFLQNNCPELEQYADLIWN